MVNQKGEPITFLGLRFIGEVSPLQLITFSLTVIWSLAGAAWLVSGKWSEYTTAQANMITFQARMDKTLDVMNIKLNGLPDQRDFTAVRSGIHDLSVRMDIFESRLSETRREADRTRADFDAFVRVNTTPPGSGAKVK